MAKTLTGGRPTASAAPSATTTDAPPPAEMQAAVAPQLPPYRAALCLESCTPCFGTGTCQVYGGEWITDQPHVKVIERDPHFRVESGPRAEIEAMIKKHNDEIEDLRAKAQALGMVLSKHGELAPPRRR